MMSVHDRWTTIIAWQRVRDCYKMKGRITEVGFIGLGTHGQTDGAECLRPDLHYRL
jgi:hypothetical protein